MRMAGVKSAALSDLGSDEEICLVRRGEAALSSSITASGLPSRRRASAGRVGIRRFGRERRLRFRNSRGMVVVILSYDFPSLLVIIVFVCWEVHMLTCEKEKS